jgi:ribonuclease P protein component
MRRFAPLRRQADFSRVRRQGRRIPTAALIIYRTDSLQGDRRALVGITVSKSIGKAVTRNKLRRRLAAIVHDALASHDAMRLLVVARPAAAQSPFRDLRAQVASALQRA